jgi:hypothetical protein
MMLLCEQVRFCGHAMHAACRDAHIASLLSSHHSGVAYEGKQSVDVEAGEFLCPLCKALTNALLPTIAPTASTATPTTQPASAADAKASSTAAPSTSQASPASSSSSSGLFSWLRPLLEGKSSAASASASASGAASSGHVSADSVEFLLASVAEQSAVVRSVNASQAPVLYSDPTRRALPDRVMALVNLFHNTVRDLEIGARPACPLPTSASSASASAAAAPPAPSAQASSTAAPISVLNQISRRQLEALADVYTSITSFTRRPDVQLPTVRVTDLMGDKKTSGLVECLNLDLSMMLVASALTTPSTTTTAVGEDSALLRSCLSVCYVLAVVQAVVHCVYAPTTDRLHAHARKYRRLLYNPSAASSESEAVDSTTSKEAEPVPEPPASLPACAQCGAVKDSNKKCSRCKLVYYCGRECQAKNWATHKADCKPAAAPSTSAAEQKESGRKRKESSPESSSATAGAAADTALPVKAFTDRGTELSTSLAPLIARLRTIKQLQNTKVFPLQYALASIGFDFVALVLCRCSLRVVRCTAMTCALCFCPSSDVQCCSRSLLGHSPCPSAPTHSPQLLAIL